jgi:hypothetical protein
MAVLTDVLATKLRGDPDNEYRLEWTEEERLDSSFLVVSALHMEALRRWGMLDVMRVPPDPWARLLLSSVGSPARGTATSVA